MSRLEAFVSAELGSQLGVETLRRLRAIENYDMGFLYDPWVEKTHGLIGQGEVELAAKELKRLFALSLIFPTVRLYPPTRIDVCWHEFILFTYEYRRFCQDILGRDLDHIPRSPIDPTEPDPLTTLDLYRQAFGEPPSEMWAPVTRAEERWLLYQHEFPDLVYKSRRSPIARLFRRVS